MAIPAIPAHGASWDAWAAGLDAAARSAAQIPDVATPGTATGDALRAALVPFWTAAEVVTAGTVRMAPDGHVIQRIANGTARGSYDATEQALWNVIGGSSAPLTVASTVSASGALVVGKHNPVNATSGTKAMTLPTGAAAGTLLSVEKTDASANTVTVTGNVRGVGGTVLTLFWQNESLLFAADSAGSWWPAAGHKTKTSLDAAYLAKTFVAAGTTAGQIPVWDGAAYSPQTASSAVARDVGAVARPQFVSAYQSTPTAFATNQASGISFRHTHKLTVAATDVRLVVPLGFTVVPSQTSTDTLGTAAVPFKGSLEVNGAIRPVLFNGSRLKTNDPGGIIVSDPIAADLAAGTAVPVRSWFNVTTGQPYPNTIGTGQGPGFTASGDGFTSGSDLTDGLTAVTAAVTTGFVPHGLIGVPVTPQVAIGGLGDSIMLGTGDAANNGGFLADATNATVPFLRLAVGGASAQGWAAGHSYSWPLLDYCTHAIVLLGANDLNTTNGPRTLVQFQADMTTIYTALRRRGLKVYACTILPRTTSSANTTVASTAFAAGGSSVRGQANAWIRGGAGGLIDGFFETADAVESGRDTGFWASSSLTSDGAHPTAAGHTLMAAAINIASLS